MELEAEIVGIRRRLARLEGALRRVDDPLAISVISAVIAEIKERIAALEQAGHGQGTEGDS